ncbi:MAG TPA: DUF58 domain-containing protein [Bacteroidia bacterium]|nr:DUF58 domain-containing protein [Bacteroidia bacterium]
MNILRSIYLTPRFYFLAGLLVFLFLLAYILPELEIVPVTFIAVCAIAGIVISATLLALKQKDYLKISFNAVSLPLVLLLATGLAYYFPQMLFPVGQLAVYVLPCLTAADVLILWSRPKGIFARRDLMEKLSNGDLNEIRIHLENKYPFPVFLEIVDELPVQFQARDLAFKTFLAPFKAKLLTYRVRPVKRGEYFFGAVNVFTSTLLGLVQRRFKYDNEVMVPVYPSFIQMRRYELLAISNRLTEAGIKKLRRVGQNMEFDQIREYVLGDDPRRVNWKATARRSRLMTNTYQDEKSQQVYALIDMGRGMKMPFEEMTLLDHAINASLVISNIAMLKYDKAGIITFSHRIHRVLPAERRGLQMHKIMELLFAAKTGYLESDYGKLYAIVKRRITQRSLLLIFTNFETLSGMQRQLTYFRKFAKDHLVVVIFFENTELHAFLDKKPETVQEIYYQTIAEKFAYEKKLIVKEFEKHGIHSVYTAPQNLTVNTINKYLELKARGLI